MLPKDIWNYVVLPYLMISKEDVKTNYAGVLDELKHKWIHEGLIPIPSCAPTYYRVSVLPLGTEWNRSNVFEQRIQHNSTWYFSASRIGSKATKDKIICKFHKYRKKYKRADVVVHTVHHLKTEDRIPARAIEMKMCPGCLKIEFTANTDEFYTCDTDCGFHCCEMCADHLMEQGWQDYCFPCSRRLKQRKNTE